MYALAQNFLAQILDAAAAEILSLLHLFFRGITPKPGISIIVRCESAIAQNRCFFAPAPVGLREEKQPEKQLMRVRSKRCDRKIQVFPR
ncbi:hypothetical protein QUA74_00995 [Microcoleus sp. LAD1_D3]|uniref:hypothetical protein n=1 Tax=Microcoleus sp. LAD1_D3 TaxID=2819365 RepID=UPI002FCF270B